MRRKVLTPKDFRYNKIYAFRYKSELAKQKKIPVYDQAPMVIFLDLRHRTGKGLGINIHWIPYKYRKAFVKLVLQLFETQKIIYPNKIPRLFYMHIKNISEFRAIAYVAIRLYFFKNISRIVEIPPDLWEEEVFKRKYRSRFAYRSKNYKH